MLAQAAVETSIRHRLELGRVPSGWWAVLGLLCAGGLIYGVVWLYRREARTGAPTWGRWLLGGLRITVLVSLLVIWLEPILAVYIERRTVSETLVLVDSSASMGLHDRYPTGDDAERIAAFLEAHGASNDEPVSRADLVHLLLTGNGGAFLDRLAERNRVKVFSFDAFPRHTETLIRPGLMLAAGDTESDATTTQPQRPATSLEPIEPTGPVTNIGRAVREAIEAAGSAPVAGVIVLSDGAFNQGEPVDVVGEFARARQIPIHVVGVGDTSEPLNVRIAELIVPSTVFIRDPFVVTAHVSGEGLTNVRVPVELLRVTDDGAGPGEVIQTQYADLSTDGQMVSVTFRHAENRAGTLNLAVRVAPQRGEILTDDNQRTRTVRILDAKLKVLLVAGGPSWEYRYVTRLLERDAAFDVSCWLQSADVDAVRDGNTIIDRLPTERAELFKYDVILLLDPNSRQLDETWCENVATLVGDHFGGLVVAAGRKFTPRFMREPHTQPIVELLPIIYDPQAEIEINNLGHWQPRGWSISIPDEARDHPVLMQTTDPAVNASVWSRLGEVYWHYPVKRHKPLASVLMRHTNPLMRERTPSGEQAGQVLLACQRFGKGRSAFLAFDSTWRWRRYGETYFNRFWVQLLRYVTEGKLTGEQKRGLILTERERYRMGEAVTVKARLLDARYMPILQDEFRAELTETAAAGEGPRSLPPVVLKANPADPGWYQGRFIAQRVGTYEVAVELTGERGEPVRIRRTVQVTRPQIELAHPQRDGAALERLAQATGGQYVELDEAGRIPDLIEDRHLETVSAGTPIALWDSHWTLVFLVGLLCLEWALRKRWRML